MKKKIYTCPKCDKPFETIEKYGEHRQGCHKNKEHTMQSLAMLGILEDPEVKKMNEKVLNFEEQREKDFRRGKF